MSRIVRAQQRETVDALCFRALGATAGVVEDTLERNPGLAAQGPVLAHGTPVELPPAPASQPVHRTVSLWD
ncbi:phage tail protein [Salinisphaera sp. USBA-960]|nr:phage tail protein [Salifodinibacter halophilus]NNC25312.1 phage tail protein [Salifodinibacter halophilus]